MSKCKHSLHAVRILHRLSILLKVKKSGTQFYYYNDSKSIVNYSTLIPLPTKRIKTAAFHDWEL